MNGSYLLDTNIVIPILNRHPALEQRIRDLTLHIPDIVLGELLVLTLVVVVRIVMQ